MFPAILIIGACRSGKSRHALTLAQSFRGRHNLFVATCVPQDAEMIARVQQHQQERGLEWQTLEAPLALAEAISLHGAKAQVMVIDCLTLWVSNLMTAHPEDNAVMKAIDRLCAVLAEPPCPLILVTNEVGAGIVPENALARRFRDLTGWANQKVAAVCSQVTLMVAGIGLPLKPRP